ncbi:MAG TPA: CHAT domain-containing tetratricopeptide repeat protein [Vicinamibacteria bacterium]|nr:CHAT domain-containing tetratricopeptide repeat protein [Vicinamibacteria bacterium]
MPGTSRGEQLYAEIGKLADERSRRRFLSRHRGLLRAETVTRLGEMVTQKVRVDVKEALALAEAAELIARRLGNDEARAHGLRAKGNALHFLHDYKAAVAHLDDAARLFAEAGKPTEVARTLSTSIQPLILLGDYEQAEAAAARARAIFTRERDELRLARLEVNVGNIYHRQDRFAEALRCYEQGYDRLLRLRNVEGIAGALSNMAMCLISLNDFPRALETHGRAREFCREHGMPRLVALADYNIAYLYYFRGQYGCAIEALKATRKDCLAAGDAYLAALCFLDLSEIYLELNLSEDAAEMAAEALSAFRRLNMGYEAAKSLSFLAIAHGQQDKALRALELCAEARALFLKEHNAVWPALLDLYQALILHGAGRLVEAHRHCADALAGFGASGLASKVILCRLLLARLALRTGDLDAARRECDAAADRLSSLDLPALAFQLHYVRGQIEQAAGDGSAAYAAYRRAQRLLETLRGSLRGEELKIAFMKNKLAVYEALVDLALAGGARRRAAAKAFSYAEQAKSRSLQDLLLRAATPIVPGAPGASDLVRRVNDLREELNWYYHRIDAEQMAPEERTEERVERLQSEVRAREAELLRVVRELPAESEPLELLAPASLPLSAVRAALPRGAMLIEYFRLGRRLLAFLVSRHGVKVAPVAAVDRVEYALRLLRFQLLWARLGGVVGASASKDSSMSATQGHLADLYEQLVSPLRKHLHADHLIFVPHDLLHYVPFHALYDGRQHLIDSFSISYAPSATIYALCHQRAAVSGGSSLVLGVPEPHTPFIADEVRAVAERLPDSELHVGEEASARLLCERAGGRRFIHIATHGFFRPDNPLFSGVRLGGSSYLTLYDLYNLKLSAELVALSACVTGRHVIAAGDELLGLARGLFRAGAASLLLALWEVPDQSTAEFMTAFYNRFLTAPSRAAALRAAVLEIRDRYPHPVHWAPFVLMGKALAA